VIVLFSLEGQQTHQVQRVRMIGIGSKRLLAAESRIVVSSAWHVGKAGLMDRNRGSYPPLVDCPGATVG
jgi:hypothetical protein